MNKKDNFALMAQYNQWMNKKIYAAAATLTADELNKDRGAFFGSILGTLNHILVGDTIWLRRFATTSERLPSLDYVRNVEAPKALNQILYSDLPTLQQKREQLDAVIVKFIDELSDEGLSLPLAYKNVKGEPHRKIFGQLLQHFFNHQTHHRGQATTLFSQLGIDVGVTDLLALIPSA